MASYWICPKCGNGVRFSRVREHVCGKYTAETVSEAPMPQEEHDPKQDVVTFDGKDIRVVRPTSTPVIKIKVEKPHQRALPKEQANEPELPPKDN